MSDIYQSGFITTLHLLQEDREGLVEKQLARLATTEFSVPLSKVLRTTLATL